MPNWMKMKAKENNGSDVKETWSSKTKCNLWNT